MPGRLAAAARPSRARLGLSDAERADWAAFARHIRLLPGRALPDLPAPPAPAPPAADAGPVTLPPLSAPARAAATPVPALRVGDAPGGLDRASWKRLQGGRLAPERTLDLHGRTAQAAFHALQTFLHRAHADRVRCVEVITGRGAGETGGVIRRELPLWLNLPPLRPLVLAASNPHPANAGAVRLLLRRVR